MLRFSSILPFLAALTWWGSSLSFRNSGRSYSNGLGFWYGSHLAFFGFCLVDWFFIVCCFLDPRRKLSSVKLLAMVTV